VNWGPHHRGRDVQDRPGLHRRTERGAPLDAFANVATTIADSANNINVGTGTPSTPLGDALRADITKQGLTEKVTLVVLLLLPWLVSVIANVLAIVLVFIRFLQMYLLISFASLPVAFFGHETRRASASAT
jgi:hypothetical protein